MTSMRELDNADLGLLLSVFAVLLLAFAADFQFSRKAVRRHRRATITFVSLNLLGELATVIALLLTWVAVWSLAAWQRIDNLLVFVPGSIAILCAAILTVESVYVRTKITINWGRSEPGAPTAYPLSEGGSQNPVREP